MSKKISPVEDRTRNLILDEDESDEGAIVSLSPK